MTTGKPEGKPLANGEVLANDEKADTRIIAFQIINDEGQPQGDRKVNFNDAQGNDQP